VELANKNFSIFSFNPLNFSSQKPPHLYIAHNAFYVQYNFYRMVGINQKMNFKFQTPWRVPVKIQSPVFYVPQLFVKKQGKLGGTFYKNCNYLSIKQRKAFIDKVFQVFCIR